MMKNSARVKEAYTSSSGGYSGRANGQTGIAVANQKVSQMAQNPQGSQPREKLRSKDK